VIKGVKFAVGKTARGKACLIGNVVRGVPNLWEALA
jgi:hypothetical protein